MFAGSSNRSLYGPVYRHVACNALQVHNSRKYMSDNLDINSEYGQLRSVVNSDVRLRNEIYQKKDGSWDRLWAAMDALEDGQVAIDDFKKLEEVSYLQLYGLLQAFVVQQDAISHIKDTVGGKKINWEKDEKELNLIRRLRNEAAGHPANIRTSDGIMYCNIDRHSIRKDSFRYLLWGKTGAESREVDLSETIATQEREFARIVTETVKAVKADEVKFIKQFVGEKLVDVHRRVNHYQFEKMYLHGSDFDWAERMFKLITRVYQELRVGLEKRYGNFESTINAPGLKLTIDEMDQLIERIASKFDAGISDGFDFTVYVGSLEASWKELGGMVQEADARFS